MEGPELWRELGQQLRVDAVRASAKAGSGHPTSSMSAADLAAVLLAAHFRYDYDEPKSPANDRLVFSKGHASPLVYGLFRAAGVLSEEEFGTYRQFGSRLEGHPTPVLPWVDVATGSLGQGLPIGVGMALAGKRLDRLPFRTWVICGDSEMAEGSMWEAAEHAAFYELDNLTAIVDVNRLGQRGETMHGWDLSSYSDRFRAFGWHAIEIDGHDVAQIDAAYTEAERTTGRPTAIVAKTIKGKGYSKLEDQGGWHGKATSPEDSEEAIAELGGIRNIVVEVPKPDHGAPAPPAARFSRAWSAHLQALRGPLVFDEPMGQAVDQAGGWPSLRRLRGHLERYGHVAVPLPEAAAARAGELLLTVPTLLRHAAHVDALDELAATWGATTVGRPLLSWGAREPHDPRGGKYHLQTTAAFDRYATVDPRAPALLRAVLARLRCFGAAADRMLAGFGAPLRTTVRANVYACDGGVPTHVDESALTVLFTDRPGSLLVAAGGR